MALLFAGFSVQVLIFVVAFLTDGEAVFGEQLGNRYSWRGGLGGSWSFRLLLRLLLLLFLLWESYGGRLS